MILCFLHLFIFTLVFFALKYHLHQQHIADSAAGDGYQHLSFPAVQYCNKQNGDEFRDAVTAGEQADIFKAVYHQKAKHGQWQDVTQILHERWCFFAFREE